MVVSDLLTLFFVISFMRINCERV